MSSLSHDDVFALRLELSDEYLDENIIIKELKLILLQNGFENEEDVNQFLVEFYQKFGFDISLETIQSISINPIQPPPAFQFLNSIINNVYIQNNQPAVNNNNISDMLESFNQIINLVNNSVGPPPMDDVKVTLKDESTIKKYKLTEDKEDKM